VVAALRDAVDRSLRALIAAPLSLTPLKLNLVLIHINSWSFFSQLNIILELADAGDLSRMIKV